MSFTALLFAAASTTTGDIYVKTDVEGARIYLDGQDTGLVTPALLEGVDLGLHEVQVLTTDCKSGWEDVVVRPATIKRAEPVLKESTGSLSVNVQPAGAEVWVDGALLGISPIEQLPLPCGSHDLRVSAVGFASHLESIETIGDSKHALNLSLEPRAVGAISVVVSPLDALLTLDGAPRGSGPMTLDDVDAGAHTLSVSAPGYLSYEESVEVAQGQILTLDLTLLPKPPLGERLGLNRVKWGTVGVGGALLGGAVATGALSLRRYQLSQLNYQPYSQLTYLDQPDQFYTEKVMGPKRAAQGLLVASGALLMGAGSSFVFLPIISPTGSGGMAMMEWRF